MSILVYKNGHLFGDSIGILESESVDTYCDVQKIFKSIYDDAYLGVLGRELIGDPQEIINLFVHCIYDDESTTHREKLLKEVRGRTLVLMTKDAAYEFGSNNFEFNQLYPDRLNCWGDGQLIVQTALHLKLNPLEAFQVYHRIAYGIPRTVEPKMLFAHQSDCRPIDFNNYQKGESNESI